MYSWAFTRITVDFASYRREKKKGGSIMNASCKACEMQCVNYQRSTESAQDNFCCDINTVNKGLCLGMSVRANKSTPELTLGSCVLLSPKSSENWHQN